MRRTKVSFRICRMGLPTRTKFSPAAQNRRRMKILLELADALCWQLRFREAIDALTQAVKLEPERMEAYRKRGPKYLDTLQFERALADYTRCEQADGMSIDVALSHRHGAVYAAKL